METPSSTVVNRLVELGRSGKAAGAGFYDYPESAPKHLWSGLRDEFGGSTPIDARDVEDRFLFAMSLETVRVWEEGVLRTVADANIGSILGIGFPPMLGGALQHVDGYEAADGSLGIAAFARRASELADRYGSHLAPTPGLLGKVAAGETYR